MSLQQDIKAGIKEAMLAKEETRLMVLRGLSSAFTNELVAKGRKPQDELSDEEALAVITRSAKQRKDSIEQFRNAGREDLAASEEAELTVVEAYLPTLMSREEVDTIVAAKKAELGVSDKADAGKLMSALMKDLKGKADGSVVKASVEASFNA